MVDTVIVENEQAPRPAIAWSAVIAGAAVSAALTLVLLALGAGLGFSVTNPWGGASAPATTKAATVAGIYLAATAVLASAVGGYIAGRLRPLWPGVHHHEAFFRDTAHGVAAWAVATLAGAWLLGSLASGVAGGVLAHHAPMMGRDASAEFTDRLFAYDANATQAGSARDYNADRAAAGRTLARAAVAGGTLTDEQRANLAAMVAARTGLPIADARARVSVVESNIRAAAETARRVGMQISFWLVIALLSGALAAGLAAWEGGAVRDGRLRY